MDVLIVLDTLRYDYGVKHLSTLMMKHGLSLVGNAISTAPWTVPSHVSMLTGLYPSLHGIHLTPERQMMFSIRPKRSTVALMIHRHYKRSILISSNILISNYYGYNFTEYYDTSRIHGIPRAARFLSDEEFTYLRTLPEHYQSKLKEALRLLREGRFSLLARSFLTVLVWKLYALAYKLQNPDWPLDMGAKRVIEVVKSLKKRRAFTDNTFLLINLMEAHDPYSVIDRKGTWPRLYERSVRYLKERLTELLEIIDPSEHRVVVVSDHGQLLGERGLYGHEFSPYPELVRVPLWTNIPVDGMGMVSTKDVANAFRDGTFLARDCVASEYFGVNPLYGAKPAHRLALYCADGSYAIKNMNDGTIEEAEGYLAVARLSRF